MGSPVHTLADGRASVRGDPSWGALSIGLFLFLGPVNGKPTCTKRTIF